MRFTSKNLVDAEKASISLRGLARCGLPFALILISAQTASPFQIPFLEKIIRPNTNQDLTWWYVTLGGLAVALFLAWKWMRRSRTDDGRQRDPRGDRRAPARPSNQRTPSAPNRAREVEWLKQQNPTEHDRLSHLRRDHLEEPFPIRDSEPQAEHQEGPSEKGFAGLPVSRFDLVDTPFEVEALPRSDDPELLNAIFQTLDGTEHDEEVRLVATRVLAMFKTVNSLEALQKIALYDISSNVRSKAVSILADFDHESVFETIVVASADPSRDVRAAAARGLARLNIDRADAWARIALSGDEFRICQVARAAIECEIAVRSIDRLVSIDPKIAYEAYVLFMLLAKAGETSTVFEFIGREDDINIKLALIKVLGSASDDRFISGLVNIGDDFSQPVEVRNAAEQTARRIAASKE